MSSRRASTSNTLCSGMRTVTVNDEPLPEDGLIAVTEAPLTFVVKLDIESPDMDSAFPSSFVNVNVIVYVPLGVVTVDVGTFDQAAFGGVAVGGITGIA